MGTARINAKALGTANNGTGAVRGGRRLPAMRQAEIANYVSEQGDVTIGALAEKFNVSFDTVRRDLDALDEEGLLIRTHGGAVSSSSFPQPDSGLELRVRVQSAAKDVIGRISAELVEDNSSIIINSGTTALALVRHLTGHKELTIATNNLAIPGEIRPEIVRDLYVFGGRVRLISQASLGPVSFRSLLGDADLAVHADLCFIGVGAVSADSGFSTSNLAEASMMAKLMESSDKVAVMADSSKFDRYLFASVAPLAAADYLITDQEPSREFMQALRDADVQVLFPGA